MKKVVYADANEELFRACSGRMTFLIENTRNIKEASSASVTKEMCEQFKPDKDHFACLQIALGDYETYGHNRNADSFPKEANIKYHDTFVKCAKVYREHANKDPNKAIGEIKASFYNPEMHRTELILWGDKKKADKEWDLAKEGKELAGSMGCFVAGTKITKADGSEIDIEDVKLGDKVITHLGNQKEVTALLPHFYTGDMYSIEVEGCKAFRGVTSEHPFLVDGKWVNACDLKEGDKVCRPMPIKNGNKPLYSYFEVKSISKYEANRVVVYNFSVEDDESYVANGVAVHNCTIAKDRDNISGKLSASPMEYEPWMKKSAGRFIKEWTMPDGSTKVINKFACVHNDTPKFIDYSFVAHPADRIAYYLEYIPGEKTASAHDDVCIPSAMLPESELLNFDTGLFSEPENINALDTLCKAESDINDYVSANINGNAGNDAIDDILLNSFDTEDECCMSDDDMDKLRALQPNVCMAELAKRGVMLPFEDFVRYAFKQSQNDVKNSPVVVFAKNVILPNAFSFAKENCNSVGNEHMFDAGSNFDCRIDLNNDCDTQNVLNSLVDKFSILPEPLMQRAVRIAVKPVKRTFKVRLIKIANATNNGMGLLSKEQLNEANKYIAQYVNYKVAAMKEIARYHNIDNNKLYLLGITQNARF